MIKIVLSRKLGELRITQTELSHATHIRLTTIGDWYHDMKDSVDLDYLDRICEALDCQVGDILEYEPNEKPRVSKPQPKKYRQRK